MTRTYESRSEAFGDSAYDVLGLDIGAHAKDVQAAYLGALNTAGRDRELRDRVSRASNALKRPGGRAEADLLTPLLGALPSAELARRVAAAAHEEMTALLPQLPDAACFGPMAD
ncbi:MULTISPECIES: hypothetical protein [unclassified Streptomyces]|uniref:hypothetical protein n=1 Tax=unclassified Streptomyces TaxID=2593676 RepID=UPI002DD8B70D|nr:hypothetical protein [Streptomyces sp. NBC_01800]WSA71700.1 hypothetical protein OIE65_34715 [Streptomyces sp. NBC_01800]WTD92385.1 hypothetical protein OG891_35105 [Streptomyces sp. NBC_01637]